MFSEIIRPRFNEMDGLGHINNTVVAKWFEGARDPIFKWFTPGLDLKAWKLILAKLTIEFEAELHYGTDVELRTYICRIGSSSFDVFQEAWQKGARAAYGVTVMVHLDYANKVSQPIPHTIKAQMQDHLIDVSAQS